MMRRRRIHQATFVAAGIYNLLWGAYAAPDPQWLFRFAGMPPANYPGIFACLGMVVGLYGILYFQVARRPEQGALPAAGGFVHPGGRAGYDGDGRTRLHLSLIHT